MRWSAPAPGPGRDDDRWRVPIRSRAAVAALILLLASASAPRAQSVTGSAVAGTVRDETGALRDGARVRVTHTGTGFTVETTVRNGRYLVQSLESGGPYSVTVRQPGFAPAQQDVLRLVAGETLEVDFILSRSITTLDTVVTAVGPLGASELAGSGTATTIPGHALQALPSLNRDLFDFVRLVPQVSTKVGLPNGGLSGGGVGFRFNDYLINGASERTLTGNVPFAFAGGRSVPLDAVREYQVLLSPYDVRYGDFAGALVNTVTRAGENEGHASVFASARNNHLAGGGAGTVDHFDREQYGATVSGPIVRNHAHYLVAAEWQRLMRPAPGPYAGQAAAAEPPLPVTVTDLAGLDAAMRTWGLEAGSPGPVTNGNPLTNVFARVDVSIPRWNGRAVIWHNVGRGDDDTFTRAARDSFSLSSYRATRVAVTHTTAVQLFTGLPGIRAGRHELLVSRRWDGLDAKAAVNAPWVRVALPSTSGGVVTVNTGAPMSAQGLSFRPRSFTVRSTVSIPTGTGHLLTAGAQRESFRITRTGLPGAWGTWTFSSLDSLRSGVAARYDLPIDFGSAEVPLEGTQSSLHLGDQWQVHPRLLVTLGIRGDVLRLTGPAPPRNRLVDSLFQRRTDRLPEARFELSPRLGLTWELPGRVPQRLRGGVGVFTSRPPLAWIHAALMNFGVGIGALGCGSLLTDRGAPPPFEPDYRNPPRACRSGDSLVTPPAGNIDLLDPGLRMMRTVHASLAYERDIGQRLTITAEALVTRTLSDFVFRNLNLQPPSGTDRDGRVLYGVPGASGAGTPALRSSEFAEVIDLRNARSRASQLSVGAHADLPGRLFAQASYTFTSARDAQTPLRVNTTGRVAWAAARPYSGREDDLALTTSTDDVPHRVVLALALSAGSTRWERSVSFTYVGESGRPFTWLAWGAGRLGDINIDGSNSNDPVYVPRDAGDPAEILFSGRSDLAGADNSPTAQAERVRVQQVAFEAFIARTPCLVRQRGKIMARNSCREPASHSTVASVRQRVPVGGGVELQLDLYNVLGLIDADWGRYRIAAPALLEHVGQVIDSTGQSRAEFRFNATAPEWTTLMPESAFQLQFALRYRF